MGNSPIFERTLKGKPSPFTVKLLEYFQENSQFLRVILGPKGDSSFQNKRRNLVQNILFNFKEKELLLPVNVFMAYVVSAHFGVMQDWLNTGMKQAPEEIALITFNMTLHGPTNTMGIEKFNITQ